MPPDQLGADLALDSDDAERWADWEPSAEDWRDIIDAENERIYDAWFESGAPFDFFGDSYLEPYMEARTPTKYERQLDRDIEDARRDIEEHNASIKFTGFLLGVGVAYERACFEGELHSEEKSDDQLCLRVCGAMRVLHKHDPTFIPRLRKLGATPAMVREANHILHGVDHEEARNVAPKPSQAIFRRRTCSRARSSRGPAPGRRQGSRRTTSRAGPSDDPGEPEPPRSAPRRHLHPLATTLILIGGRR